MHRAPNHGRGKRAVHRPFSPESWTFVIQHFDLFHSQEPAFQGIDGAAAEFQPSPMKPRSPSLSHSVRRVVSALSLTVFCRLAVLSLSAADGNWRSLPLITNGKLDPNWVHVGWGGFVVDDGALRTACVPQGLGLLVFKKERLGNCQVRVVFKAKDAKSNAGIYVRLADGILDQVGKPGAAFDRDATGKISKDSMSKVQASAERDEGPWYAVHHGYEVQIADGGDPFHRTGSIYSLAPSSAEPTQGGTWRTMVITLDGEQIRAELDGKSVSNLDLTRKDLPPRKQWHEPKREPKRPVAGYIGLQNHDPGDVVWFKEVSVRPLPVAGK